MSIRVHECECDWQVLSAHLVAGVYLVRLDHLDCLEPSDHQELQVITL